MSDNDKPLIWSPTTRYLVTTLLFGTAVALAFYARVLVTSLVIASIITYILNPIARFFENRFRMPHRIAATVAYGLFIVVILTGLATSTPVIISRVTGLAQELDTLILDVEAAIEGNTAFLGFDLPLIDWLENFRVTTASNIVPADLLSIASNVSANMLWVLVTFVTIFYLLQDWRKLRDWVFVQVPISRRDDVVRLYFEIKNVWQAYLRGQLVLMFVVGLLSWLGAAALGLQGAWVIGLLAGILDVVPSVGPTIAAVIGIGVAFLTGSSFLPVSNVIFAIMVLVLFLVVQGAENIWLRPRILGNSLHMHPAFVFIGVMSSLALAGVFVTLVIVPVMGTVGVLWQYLRARMLGVEPWSDDAMPDEVRVTLDSTSHLKTKPLNGNGTYGKHKPSPESPEPTNIV